MEYRNGMNESIISSHVYDPKTFTDMGGLLNHDRWVKQDIERLKNRIEELEAYRLELAERAKELTTMSYTTRVTLKRERSWKDSLVIYTITTEKVFDDGSIEKVERKEYCGKERHKAIKDFKAMQKQLPGFEYVQDIEKARWER